MVEHGGIASAKISGHYPPRSIQNDPGKTPPLGRPGRTLTLEPHLPKNRPGARRVDDRRVISGIVHMLKCGGRWQDCPREYGPPTTIYNRWNRWSRRGLWRRILAALSGRGPLQELALLDSTYVKAHRSAHGAKGGPRRRPSASRAAAGRARSTRFATSSAARSPSR
jgi:transposase